MDRGHWTLLAIIALLLVIIAYLLFYPLATSTVARSSAQQTEPTLSEQRECAKQAEHVFTAEGWNLSGAPVNNSFASYTSHFNPRLNRCFMRMQTTTYSHDSYMKNTVVIDAFEGTTYGSFDLYGADPIQARIQSCDLTVPHATKRTCTSQQQWEQLVRPYIETAAGD